MSKNLVTICNSTVHKTIIRDKKNYYNEKQSLQVLHLNYKDYLNVNYYPFPRLLEYNDKELSLTLSYCGLSLNKISKLNISNAEACINNILYNVTYNNIIDLDIKTDNICILFEKIYLIDFDKVSFSTDKQINYTADYYLFKYLIDKKTAETAVSAAP